MATDNVTDNKHPKHRRSTSGSKSSKAAKEQESKQPKSPSHEKKESKSRSSSSGKGKKSRSRSSKSHKHSEKSPEPEKKDSEEFTETEDDILTSIIIVSPTSPTLDVDNKAEKPDVNKKSPESHRSHSHSHTHTHVHTHQSNTARDSPESEPTPQEASSHPHTVHIYDDPERDSARAAPGENTKMEEVITTTTVKTTTENREVPQSALVNRQAPTPGVSPSATRARPVPPAQAPAQPAYTPASYQPMPAPVASAPSPYATAPHATSVTAAVGGPTNDTAGVSPGAASAQRRASYSKRPDENSYRGTVPPQQYGSMGPGAYSFMNNGYSGVLNNDEQQEPFSESGSFYEDTDVKVEDNRTMYETTEYSRVRRRQSAGDLNPYGSAWALTGDSAYGGNGGYSAVDFNASQGPAQNSMYGYQGTSLYGMQRNSNYGSGMYGSAYGYSANSLYGMQPGSMMNMPNSLYGSMSQRSLYNVGTLGRYNTLGLGSDYGSLYGMGRVSARSSFRGTGGYTGPNGLYRMASSDQMSSKYGSLYSMNGDFSELPRTSTKLYMEATPLETRSAPQSPPQPKAAAPLETAVSKVASPTLPVATPVEVTVEPTRKRSPASTSAEKIKVETPKLEAPPRVLTKSVNDNVHTVAICDSRALMRDGKAVVQPDGTVYEMDEVTTTDAFRVEKSDVLTDIVENVYCGHNVSVLVLANSQPSTSLAEKVTTNVLSKVIGVLEEAAKAGNTFEIWASSVAFPDPSTTDDIAQCRDLLAIPVPEAGQPCVPGMSPIFGPGIMDVSEVHVFNEGDTSRLVTAALKSSKPNELATILIKVRQTRNPSGNGKDSGKREVFVSAIMVSFFRGASSSYLPVIIARKKTIPHQLFINAVGGASRTAVVIPVSAQDTKQQRAAALGQAVELRQVVNAPLRSGSVRRFAEFTQSALDNKIANGETNAELLDKMRRMLADALDLLNNSDRVTPKVYPLSTDNPASVDQLGTSLSVSRKDVQPEVEVPKPSESRSIPKPSPRAVEAPTEPTPAVSPATELDDSVIAFGVVIENGAESKSFPGRTLTLPGSTHEDKTVTPNEVIERQEGKLSAFPESALVNRTQSRLLSGFNVGIVSAETVRTVPLSSQVTWLAFEQIVTAALNNAAEGIVSNQVSVYMAVIQKRQILMDVISGKGDYPLVVASSPLFGIVPDGLSSVKLTEAGMAAPAIHEALEKAEKYFGDDNAEEGTMLVGIAVYKMMKKDDVFATSLFCTSSRDEKVLDAMQRNDQAYSRSLLSYVLGGTCATTVLAVTDSLSVLSNTPEAAKMIDTLRAVTQHHNMASRDGSVQRYIKHTERSVAAATEKIATTTDSRARAQLRQKLEANTVRHDDHVALLEKPTELDVPAYLQTGERQKPREAGASAAKTVTPPAEPKPVEPARRSPRAGASPKTTNKTDTSAAPICTVVAVLHDKTDEDPLKLTEEQGEVRVSDGYKVKPSALLDVHNTNIRCAAIDALVEKHIEGYNTAFISGDTEGSTVGRSVAVKCIHSLLEKLPSPQSEVYWSVSVVNAKNEVKNMMAAVRGEEVGYEPMHLFSSPLYGPGISTTPLEKVSAEGTEVERYLRAATLERKANGRLVFAHVVSKIVNAADGDVWLPSFAFALMGEDVSAATEAMQRSARDRGVLTYAIGGSCSTVFLTGVEGSRGTAAKPLLQLAEEMNGVKNSPLRHCSIRRFTDFLKMSIAELQRQLDTTPEKAGPSAQAKLDAMQSMLADADAIVSDPAGKKPILYRRS